MKVLNAILRGYAYVYFLLIGAFLAGLGLVAYQSGVHNINTGGMTTISGETLSQCLLAMGLGGIACAAVAAFGKLRWPLTVYGVCAVITLVRWFFVSSYRFETEAAFRGAIWLVVGAVGATLCSMIRPAANHGAKSKRK